jgi:hypothetical protein
VTDSSQTSCSAAFNNVGTLQCNTGTISGSTLEAGVFNINNGTPGQIVGKFSDYLGDTGFSALNNGFGNGFLSLAGDQGIILKAGSLQGTQFADGNVYGAYSPPGPGIGLYIHSSYNNFGMTPSNVGSLNLMVGDTAAGSYQYVLTANDNGVSGTKSTLNLSPNGGVTNIGALLQLHPYTVTTLPTCVAGIADTLATVTDATAPTYGGALTGGGSVRIPVFCNGSTWTAH